MKLKPGDAHYEEWIAIRNELERTLDELAFQALRVCHADRNGIAIWKSGPYTLTGMEGSMGFNVMMMNGGLDNAFFDPKKN